MTSSEGLIHPEGVCMHPEGAPHRDASNPVPEVEVNAKYTYKIRVSRLEL